MSDGSDVSKIQDLNKRLRSTSIHSNPPSPSDNKQPPFGTTPPFLSFMNLNYDKFINTRQNNLIREYNKYKQPIYQ